MLILSIAFGSLSLILGLSFYRKYQTRLRSGWLDTLRYSRIGDYYGRPILLAFEYRPNETTGISTVEADVDEIYHYGRDYYLKGHSYLRGHSPDRKRRQIFKWSRISNPRVRYDGRNLGSLEALFLAAEEGGSRIAA